MLIQFPVTMRAAPTLVQTTGTNYYGVYRNSGSDFFDGFTAWNRATTIYGQLDVNSGISGTAGHSGPGRTDHASSSLAFSAEL